MSDIRHHCKEFSRAAMLRRGARRGRPRACPRSRPGMPLPAGTGLDRRTFLSRTLGAALTVYGAVGARADALRRRDRTAPRQPSHGDHDARHDLRARAAGTRSRSSTRPATRSTAGSAPRSRSSPDDGPALRERLAPALAPVARAAREAARPRNRLTVFPAIGYTHPDQSHFTSRHYWEVGALDPQLSTGWLGRAPRRDRRRRRTRCRGSRSTRRSCRRSRPRRVPVATLEDPTEYGFDSHNVWDVPGDAAARTRSARSAGSRSRPTRS